MTAWFSSLSPVWQAVGYAVAVLVAIVALIAALGILDAAIQRWADRDALTPGPIVPTVPAPPVQPAPSRGRDLTDTAGGGRVLTAADRQDIAEDQRYVRLADGAGEI